VKRWSVPGIPFLFSMALSLSTAGSHLYWQDSGFFLVAVKELGVLYPPGFALYVLLCRAWTMAMGFLDFTYAVHLFSSFCIALAAGTLAVAARDLLRTKGPIFHTVEEGGPLAEIAGVATGCLFASAYTVGAAAILAKGYAFYFLILTLLIWRMIRGDESGRPRDFTIVAVLIGLSWQAHPSATNLGLALILFVAFHRKALGWKGLAWRTGLAAVCATGPIHLLPIMARFGSKLQFGDPGTLDGFWSYLVGSRFTGMKGAWGLEGPRVASVGRYFWEDFLGVGVLLVGAGLWRLWLENRRLLFGVVAWGVPVLVVTVFFRIEGQHDFWMVAAWIPLWLVAAVGMTWAGRVYEIVAAVALIGCVWAVIANRKDLDQRQYTLAESLASYYLENLPDDALLATSSDDVYAGTLYLQRIRGFRKDVDLVAPYLRIVFAGESSSDHRYYELPQVLQKEAVTVAAEGPLIRWGPGPLREWPEPVRAEDLPAQFRRARGQSAAFRPEAYEMRFLRVLLLARKSLAETRAREGRFPEAAGLLESIFALDPGSKEDASIVFPLAVVDVGMNRFDQAEAHFKTALSGQLTPEQRARAFYFLAALCGSRPEGAEWKARALASPDLAPELRAKLEGR